MPAKKHTELKYKPFVGRMFSIRKHKTITGYPVTPNVNRTKYTHKDFGDIVLIFDETNTQVRVTDRNGKVVWIPKFFLLSEIKNSQFQKIDTITEFVNKFISLSVDAKVLLDNDIVDKKELSDVLNKLEEEINNLRNFADDYNPTCKNN